jgi:hypothetical protein
MKNRYVLGYSKDEIWTTECDWSESFKTIDDIKQEIPAFSKGIRVYKLVEVKIKRRK